MVMYCNLEEAISPVRTRPRDRARWPGLVGLQAGGLYRGRDPVASQYIDPISLEL